jgi:hypothetical protein
MKWVLASTHQQSRIILSLDVTAIILAGDQLVATDGLVLLLLGHSCKLKATFRARDCNRKV